MTSSQQARDWPPGVAEELAAAWRQAPGKCLFLVLFAAWLALYHWLGNSTFGYVDSPSLFGWLRYAYSQSNDDEMGRYVPFAVLALCWWKRDDLAAVEKRPWAGGALLLALALALHLVGFLIQQTRISVASFYLGIYALIGMTWGWSMLKAVFFPCFLFVFCVPLGTLAESITFPLRMLATSITTWICQHILGIDLIRNGTQLFDAQGTFQYEVAAACGGLRSLTATLALSSVYAFVTLERPWRRLLMILCAFPLAVAGNVLRLTLIILAAEGFGQKAGNWVHDDPWMSLLPYVPAFLGLSFLGSWLKEDRTKRVDPPQPGSPVAPQTQ
ncbi:MAG: exosortase/archaeosortase family protein [Verrucomicrobiales bacterium]|nr:exosortase/archaeosortase family protein [Verrucomicrobiales bacterium]